MVESKKIKWLYGLSALYIALNTVFIANEFFWFSLFPVLLLIILLSLIAIDKLLMIIVFCTPLAVNLQDMDVRIGLSLPTEPLMFGVMLIFLIRLFYEKKYDVKILKHPVTIAIIINLIWIFITSITSEIPIISFKFLLSRLWFVISFYFLAVQFFKNTSNIPRFIWLYILPFTIVILYTLYMHSLFYFEEGPANWVMNPFYNDHTVYGAMLAMFYPALIFFCFKKKYSASVKIISLILLALFTVALIFSYTRAAWLSLFAAFGIYLLFILQIKFRTILLLGIAVSGLFFAFRTDIIMKLERNRQDASDDFTKHLQSVSNISSDASNLERINRWNSAFRMFKERPVLGWGPGTYSFVYAPFQHSSEKTIISTNAGDKGNAHSEYIGPLSESGIPGALSFIAIIICALFTGARLYKKLPDKEMRSFSLVLLLGLFTYFIHGALNNFLDTDKASVPFWGFIAILVAMDIYHTDRLKTEEQNKLKEATTE